MTGERGITWNPVTPDLYAKQFVVPNDSAFCQMMRQSELYDEMIVQPWKKTETGNEITCIRVPPKKGKQAAEIIPISSDSRTVYAEPYWRTNSGADNERIRQAS